MIFRHLITSWESVAINHCYLLDNEVEKEEERPVKRAKNRSDLAINDFKSQNCGKHTPETVGHDKRLACKVCKQRSSHICKECGVHLHIECWSTWHDKENSWA